MEDRSTTETEMDPAITLLEKEIRKKMKSEQIAGGTRMEWIFTCRIDLILNRPLQRGLSVRVVICENTPFISLYKKLL
jgi:hypothetical protein